MDENANANAQGTQPNPAPEASGAANDTNPSTATTTEATDAKEQGQKADPQAGVSFDPEIQKFLDNQNIKTDDLKAAVTELAKRNMKMRGHQNEPSVAEVLGKKEEPKVENPIAKAMEQNQPATPPQSAPQPQQTSQPRVPSDMDIANVSMFVKQQYPDVTTDAKFYQSMINDGFKPVTADGQINLKSVLSAEKTIKANEPQAGQIPAPSNQPEYAKVDTVKNMDETAAQNIVMWSNNEKKFGRPIHPQYSQAVQYLQDLARKQK